MKYTVLIFFLFVAGLLFGESVSDSHPQQKPEDHSVHVAQVHEVHSQDEGTMDPRDSHHSDGKKEKHEPVVLKSREVHEIKPKDHGAHDHLHSVEGELGESSSELHDHDGGFEAGISLLPQDDAHKELVKPHEFGGGSLGMHSTADHNDEHDRHLSNDEGGSHQHVAKTHEENAHGQHNTPSKPIKELVMDVHDQTFQVIKSEMVGDAEGFARSIQGMLGLLQEILDGTPDDHGTHSYSPLGELRKKTRGVAIHLDRIEYAHFQKDERKVNRLVGKLATMVRELEESAEGVALVAENSTETPDPGHEGHAAHGSHH